MILTKKKLKIKLSYSLFTAGLIFIYTISLNAGDNLKPVSWQDVADWMSISGGSVTTSNNGEWIAYWETPNNGNSTLILQSTIDTIKKEFEVGGAPSGGSPSAIRFSTDSRYMAFIVYPPERLPGSRPPTGRRENKLTLINLNDFDEKSYDNIRSFSFSEENSGWLAIHLTIPRAAQDNSAGRGTDLLLIELATGAQLNIGNVASYSFNKTGTWFSWLTDTWGQAGNGINLRDMRTGTIYSPESDKAEYRFLNWNKEGDGLTVLKGVEDKNREEKVFSVIGLKNFGRSNPEVVIYNPDEDPNFPADMSISSSRMPYWSDGFESFIFGINENKRKKIENKDEGEGEEEEKVDSSSNKDEKPDLVIWHWLDTRLQSVQKNREITDKNFNYISAYHIKDKKFVQLADDEVRTVSAAPLQKYGIGTDNSRYELMNNLSGENYTDVYIVDFFTGEKRLILENHLMQGGLSTSPDGKKFAYYSEGHYFVCNFETGESISITKDIPTTFIDLGVDRNQPFPPTPLMGWSDNSSELLIRDNYNIWKVAADGRRFENLTVDGSREGRRYQFRFFLDPDEQGINFREPLFIRVFDQSTKQSGIVRIDRGRSGAKTVLFGDAIYSSLRKVKDKDIYFFTKETVINPPDYYMAKGHDLTNPQKITDIGKSQKEFALSPGARLLSFVSDRGDTLHATLYLPANYVEGEKYPTLVYIYERLTQNTNSYARPAFPGGGFNRAIYNSNGYAVLMPDIVYEMNDPGMSAVWCVLPALDAAIETGVVDPEKVGIHGHSWGGYQTSFLITQTNRFKAAVAGAPLTNMISMYSLIYWNTGSSNQSIFESSQGRLSPGYWDNLDAFTRNSPVYFARNVNTPLLLMHNDKDGAVDFTQGVEYYNTLRRLKKPVIMLQYEGENHGLRTLANQIDYGVRMMEFLDYHLKGTEPSKWITDGVPLLYMEKHLEQRDPVLNP